ncbi:phenoloxidase-activating factor 2 [Bacillus rossius redtenbacheri]|uniref:phenoloxidase-activating factor 2 n=1 Tax=Bacillus rossius redtenbacheri TaxID=93214 RepID=UPI002FDE6EE8
MILDGSNSYVGGAVLIGPRHLLTAAHKVAPYVSQLDARNLWASPRRLKVRLGEWNTQSTAEPYPFVECDIARVVVHPRHNPTDLRNDVAVITLKAAVPAGRFPHIRAACLPAPHQDFTNQRCWVAGWGKSAFGPAGSYQNTQREVGVPVLPGSDCERRLRETRLGPSYRLDRASFLCAGGEPGMDACTGDGGSPLVCESRGHFTLAGLVSWGIGCAESGVPGVYVNVPGYRDWIDQQTKG